MFAILLAVIQTAAPVTAECAVMGRMDGSRLTQIGLACPNVETDPEGLRAAATEVIDRLEDSYDVRALQVGDVTTELVFEHDGEIWRLPAPEPFLSSLPDYPRRAAELGYSGRCDLAFTLNVRGRPEGVQVRCARFRRTSRTEPGQIFERGARETAERFVYFAPDPARVPLCVETAFDYTLEGVDPLETPVAGAPRCPGGAAE